MVTTQRKALRVMVVEDDADTAEVISILLGKAGYHIQALDSGREALPLILENHPDLVLLDLRLPDLHGMEVLARVRRHSFLPIIVLSGSPLDNDRVMALNMGADDYMSKPFSNDELLARVKALLRRVEWTPQNESRLVVRRLELDIPRRQVHIRGRRLHLTPIEYGILVHLMRHSGRIVTHRALLRAVWGDQYREDYSVLRVNISRLRHKIEENPRRPAYIVTVPGKGYWMPQDNAPPQDNAG